MASVIKAQSANARKADAKGKRKRDSLGAEDETDVLASSESKKRKNKQRVLLLSSRGVTHRMRHLMNDLEILLPHVKKGMNI